MRELRIVERHGQVVVETSDGRRSVGATVSSALAKLFGEQPWASISHAFRGISESPDPSRIREGPVGT